MIGRNVHAIAPSSFLVVALCVLGFSPGVVLAQDEVSRGQDEAFLQNHEWSYIGGGTQYGAKTKVEAADICMTSKLAFLPDHKLNMYCVDNSIREASWHIEYSRTRVTTLVIESKDGSGNNSFDIYFSEKSKAKINLIEPNPNKLGKKRVFIYEAK